MNRQKIIMCSILILLVGVIMVYIVTPKCCKQLNEQEFIQLMNKEKGNKNIKKIIRIEENSGQVSYCEFMRKDNIEICRENSSMVWIDKEKDKKLIIDTELKYYQIILGDYEEENKYDESEHTYNFIKYEKYNGIECAVVKIANKDLWEDEIWIDLASGVRLKKISTVNIGDGAIYQKTEYTEVYFDCVTDEDILEPDVSQYSTEVHLNQFEKYQ